MTTTENLFKPAIKQQLKARIALDGPTGAGKTWTSLEVATVLAEGGKIAMIDTEKRSGLFYANKFKFDHMDFRQPYEPQRLVDTLKNAEEAGYAVAIIDSFSHFYEGEGGLLDVVDAAAARSQGNTFAGWKTGTPTQRWIIDTILSLDMHVIVCMRSKMEWVLDEYTDKNGRKKSQPRKIGLKPVQRDGVEYEFTIVGDIDLDHKITITKSRCDLLADQLVQPHRAGEMAETFLGWLNDGELPPEPLSDEERLKLHDELLALKPGDQDLVKHWMKARGFFVDRLSREDADTIYNYLDELMVPEAAEEVEEEPVTVPTESLPAPAEPPEAGKRTMALLESDESPL